MAARQRRAAAAAEGRAGGEPVVLAIRTEVERPAFRDVQAREDFGAAADALGGEVRRVAAGAIDEVAAGVGMGVAGGDSDIVDLPDRTRPARELAGALELVGVGESEARRGEAVDVDPAVGVACGRAQGDGMAQGELAAAVQVPLAKVVPLAPVGGGGNSVGPDIAATELAR